MNYEVNSRNCQSNAAVLGQSVEPMAQPALFQEADAMLRSIEALEMEIGWLIGTISSVCQTQPPRAVAETGQQVKAASSEFRSRLMEHRQRIDNMFARINDLKHTIEL